MRWVSWVDRAWDMAWRRASFSGFGGIGGAGMLVFEELV